MSTLIDLIRRSTIGRDQAVVGPFGEHPIVYADYTASGRALSFIEEYISSMVLPLYANTHTESSGTGLQTSRFRQEAREIIASCVGATDEHVVIFCGSGATGAIDKLVRVLGLRIPSNLNDRFGFADAIKDEDRPVVFIGPYEHHSNELPWRESIATVVSVDEDPDGHIDVARLEEELRRYQDRPQLIGSFSAASNVTGIKTDTAAVSSLLHKYGALALWDFAAAAPYVHINMGSTSEDMGSTSEDMGSTSEPVIAPDGRNYFDAVFISPHKFIGGPGTPGLLIARRELFTNRVPAVPGGGTVSFVNDEEHDYLDAIDHREEGGTPDIIGSIRAGLVFQLKDAVGSAEIERREKDLVDSAIEAWSANPNINILGNLSADRLSIVSFTVRNDGRHLDHQHEFPHLHHNFPHLHHNYVVAVLNDLFGIQARGGCSCAGPYGHRLLNIDLDQSHDLEHEISQGCEGIKPGWVRVNFNYFIDDETARYIVDAVNMVADSGAALLPYYRFEPGSGLWQHRLIHDEADTVAPPLSLHEISYDGGVMAYAPYHPRSAKRPLSTYLGLAERCIADAAASPPEPLERPLTTPGFERLRWFPYPDEALNAGAPTGVR